MNDQTHHFFAYIARMKHIQRWSLMRNSMTENVQEHSLQVAIVSHALAVIKNKFYGGDVSPDRVALFAIFHDATEVITGDLPTPVKYFSPEIREAYKAIEGHAAHELLRLLPDELKPEYADLLSTSAPNEIRELVKAADNICAFIKCLEEESAGNREFTGAKKTIEAKIIELSARPEIEYFMRNFVPSFRLTLDEMSPK